MEVVGSTIAIVSNVVQNELSERIAHVECCWNRTRWQLEFIQRIWPTLSEDHQSIQEEILKVLKSKLESADKKLSKLLKRPSESTDSNHGRPAVSRWKYLFVKSHLDETIKSLNKWQAMYDPSWYLIIRVASPIIDAELRSPKIAVSQDATDWFIVDPVPCLANAYVGLMTKDIRTLAAKLHHADPLTFGVLRCRGAVKVNRNSNGKLVAFDLVFETSTSEKPRTLRSCLVQRTPHSLTERLELGRQLAKSVNYVHTLDFVHKNVRPDNLVGFGDADLGLFYLVGFEQVRSAEGMTYLQGDTDWQKNIYRHPSRQGLSLDQPYCMQHDIYSLGVCLLEIGLWESFVVFGQDDQIPLPNTTMLQVSIEELRTKSPIQVKDLLVYLAKQDLPRTMGEIYSDVVVNCLTCLDEDNVDFGDSTDFEGNDGVAVGVRYIEKILLSLGSISV
ncbi:hypothetical protein M409DRAFT_68654 [Zasmidium cellare ATCC 36951]|uniref:Protein kinase domain-containing protein n=1 Tax=Zasmidium cellare ATCC 36951 TaxID=1080233 RepID=A0A6A6C7H4_ZASCE|nr:uncharacterized protein M409DRAFT_68654 [Zasmidium cellare ATCC 36951]KAF2163001.1 hypothetical protein M409DRAFT_68654 [Zasmidium cellare ATCC 36951]